MNRLYNATYAVFAKLNQRERGERMVLSSHERTTAGRAPTLVDSFNTVVVHTQADRLSLFMCICLKLNNTQMI